MGGRGQTGVPRPQPAVRVRVAATPLFSIVKDCAIYITALYRRVSYLASQSVVAVPLSLMSSLNFFSFTTCMADCQKSCVKSTGLDYRIR